MTLEERIDRCGNTGTLLKLMLALRGKPAFAPLLLSAAKQFGKITEGDTHADRDGGQPR